MWMLKSQQMNKMLYGGQQSSTYLPIYLIYISHESCRRRASLYANLDQDLARPKNSKIAKKRPK